MKLMRQKHFFFGLEALPSDTQLNLRSHSIAFTSEVSFLNWKIIVVIACKSVLATMREIYVISFCLEYTYRSVNCNAFTPEDSYSHLSTTFYNHCSDCRLVLNISWGVKKLRFFVIKNIAISRNYFYLFS